MSNLRYYIKTSILQLYHLLTLVPFPWKFTISYFIPIWICTQWVVSEKLPKDPKENSAFFLSHFFLFCFYFYLFIYIILTFIHMCIHCLVYSPPCSTPPNFQQNLFCLLVLQLCWRENIRQQGRHSVFASWDKDSYTEKLLALLPCTCVLKPTLVHLYQTSSLLPGHLPIVVPAGLRLLYLLAYSRHITTFKF
jgi:hypothetical protein